MTVSRQKRKPVIYNVRHGESITNVSRHLHARIADPLVWLTEKGHAQAQASALFMLDILRAEATRFKTQPGKKLRVRVMRSEYRRAVQTSDPFIAILQILADEGLVEFDVKTEHRLRELEFGYVGAIGKRLKDDFPHVDHVQAILRYQGQKFYASRYGGEAPADVDTRVRSILGAMYRDMEENDITHFIVIAHGLTNRVFRRAIMKYDNAWYEKTRNPDNTSIWKYNQGVDEGYIFPNPNGQWDPTVPEDEVEDVSTLNTHGLFFSPEQMEALIDLQQSEPDIMERINAVIQGNPGIPTSEAIALAQGRQSVT